jgi:ABC-type Zn uptake system ZnuABC Zn-binding protein ZnuA
MGQSMHSSTDLVVAPFLMVIMCIVDPLNVLGSNSTLITNKTTSPANDTFRSKGSSQGKVSVVASCFPIYEFVKWVGGDKIDLSSLILIGSEPHRLDPTIQDIQKADPANLLVYNGASILLAPHDLDAVKKIEVCVFREKKYAFSLIVGMN